MDWAVLNSVMQLREEIKKTEDMGEGSSHRFSYGSFMATEIAHKLA